MTEHLISMFIDDELNLDEKIDFVETVHGDTGYKTEAVELLNQEKVFRAEPARMIPPVVLSSAQDRRHTAWLRPLLAGLAAAVVFVILWQAVAPHRPETGTQLTRLHRFIIYRPDTRQVEISGSFTGWQPQTMQAIGDTGYWEAEFELSGGEHRFAYILEGERRIADPTILAREKDDFGGENSILSVSI